MLALAFVLMGGIAFGCLLVLLMVHRAYLPWRRAAACLCAAVVPWKGKGERHEDEDVAEGQTSEMNGCAEQGDARSEVGMEQDQEDEKMSTVHLRSTAVEMS